MLQLKTYHRPSNVAEALQLLSRPNVNTTLMGGGTRLVAHMDEQIEEIVDLQNVGLAEINYQPPRLTLGAMVRLQTIVDDVRLPALLRQTARQELPSTLRNMATIGGLVVSACAESELLAALLVYEATVQIETAYELKSMSLTDFWGDVPTSLVCGIVTSVSLAISGQTTTDRVARTPMDKAIVAAVARQTDDGNLYLALCGVAKTPILVNQTNIQEQIDPPHDFRGSAEYRRKMAEVLVKRVIRK